MDASALVQLSSATVRRQLDRLQQNSSAQAQELEKFFNVNASNATKAALISMQAEGLNMWCVFGIVGLFVVLLLVLAHFCAPNMKVASGMTKKTSHVSSPDRSGFRAQLGEFLESPKVTGVVILLILVDLGSTVINDMLENTDLLNPKYNYWPTFAGDRWASRTHDLCVYILCIFLVEQILHMFAFGWAFFSHGWMVMDLVIVSISLICETVFLSKAEDWLALLIVLRLWKVVAFVFDVLLAKTESSEGGEEEVRGHHFTKKLCNKESDENDDFFHQLGEIMESPKVAAVVILLIFIDLFCTVINVTLEETELLNPKYDETGEQLAEWTHNICVTILSIFLVEQFLHLIAFGMAFFTHGWMVMDLCIVAISLFCETVMEGTAEELVGLLIVLRLWKVLAFIFDILLLEKEREERSEKMKDEN